MPTVESNGITITYERFGDESGTPLLLIHGLGAQLVDWDDRLIADLVDEGFHVIAFDNRDIGLSTWFDEAGLPDFEALLAGESPVVPYLIPDMAADAAGLLAALGIDSAHVLGVSMGGMIAQQFAIDYPDATRTLTSIMSTPDMPNVGQPSEKAGAALLVPPPTTVEEAQDAAVAMWEIIGSTGFPMDAEGVRARAARAFERASHPDGTARQMVAIMASPDRRPGLAGVAVPTLVVHGDIDPLVTLPGGEATAAAIPGAELWVIPGMGHDLPIAVWPELLERLVTLTSSVA